MFGLFLIYLVVFIILAALLFAGTTWFQGYIYSEPAEELLWRAPAAAGGITLFLVFWGFLAYRSPGDYQGQFQSETLGGTKEFEKMKVVDSNQKTTVVTRVPGRRHYVDAQGQPMKTRPFEVIVEEDGQEVHFKADRDEKGYFAPDKSDGLLWYRDDKGRAMSESSLGELAAPRRGLFFGNLLLNLVHFGVWFVCCWLLLRYQWSHALGVAALFWLIMTLAVAQMLIKRVEDVRKERDKSAATSQLLRGAPITRCA